MKWSATWLTVSNAVKKNFTVIVGNLLTQLNKMKGNSVKMEESMQKMKLKSVCLEANRRFSLINIEPWYDGENFFNLRHFLRKISLNTRNINNNYKQ